MNTRAEQSYGLGRSRSTATTTRTLILRFQRVSPMEVSLFDSSTVYYGSQYVHRSHDGGVHWEKISPDLTANPPGPSQGGSGWPITRDVTGEEFYSTLYAISESKLEPGVILDRRERRAVLHHTRQRQDLEELPGTELGHQAGDVGLDRAEA